MVINGKTWEQVNNELRAPIPDDVYKYSDKLNFTYLDKEFVQNRMDTVFGPNYSVDYNSEVLTLPDANGEVASFIQTKCTITIYDDDGRIVTTRSRIGGERILRLKDGERQGSVADFGNSIDSSCTDAFKRCCKNFGISSDLVGKGDLRPNRNGNRGRNNNTSVPASGNSGTSSGANPQEGTYTITFVKEFAARGSSGGYAADVIVGGNKDDVRELLVWSNSCKAFLERFGSEWMKRPYAGQQLVVTAKETCYNNKSQLSLKSVVSWAV